MTASKSTDSTNYYRILGTNSNASDDLIKQRYLEKVREFPPESHPEEFKRIREAYDTLKDPFKKSEYDLQTKYQGKAGRLLDDAMFNMTNGNYQKAERLLDGAEELAGDNHFILKVRGHLALFQNNYGKFESIFENIDELTPSSKKFIILINKAYMLLKNERTKPALKVTKKIADKYPEEQEAITNLYISIYDQQEKFTKVWNLLSKMLKDKDEISERNINLFLSAVHLIVKYGKWKKKESLIASTKTLVEKINDNEEMKYELIEILTNEMEKFDEYDPGIRLFYLELLELFIDDPFLKAEKEKIILTEKIVAELDKMMKNCDVSPYIFYQGGELFHDWAYPEEDIDMFMDIPPNTEIFKEEYLANLNSIDVLKNNYPNIYQEFEDEWLQLKKESKEKLTDSRRMTLFENSLDTDEDSKYKMLDNGQIINKKKVRRNDPCPCGSGKKYKKCCL